MFTRELKKGSTELMILALLEKRARHGYEIGKKIEAQSGGRLQYRISTMYPVLFRLEQRGLIQGRWVEKAGERRRRFYRLTPAGAQVLGQQLKSWREFTAAVEQVIGCSHA